MAAFAPVTAAHAADEKPVKHLTRLCDPTGCLVAWAVADSDGDGVCDADELVAGTDPFDPLSKPSLTIVVSLAADHKLPSLENGLAALVVFPDEIIKAREKFTVDLLGAFQMNTRKDTLTRLGISADLLSSHGISAGQGLTIGLDHPSKDGGLPGRKVGGIDASLISAGGGTPTPTVGGGGVKEVYEMRWGTKVTVYNDKSTKSVDKIPLGVVITTTNSKGDTVSKVTETGTSSTTGSITTTTKNTKTESGDGALLSTVQVDSVSQGGTTVVTTVTTEYINDASGKAVGTKITTKVETFGKDGSYSSAESRKACDANGKQCSEPQGTTDGTGSKYIDPEYAYSNMVTIDPAGVDGVLRMRGAAVNVVQGWTAPGLENDPKNPRDPSTVELVDSDTGLFYLLVEPLRVTTAQPEGRPDLPNPMDGATPKSGGGCNGLCS